MALGANAQLAIILKLVDKATPGLKNVTKQAETMGQKMGRVGASLTRNLTLPLLAVVGAGVKVYASFDKTMTNLEARTGATAQEMEAFREAAIKMGRDSAFSATQAADAILELTASGSSATEALEQLTPVLNLAAAGQLELGESADYVTDILAQFQLGAEDSTYVVDNLARASQKSSADVRMMAAAFSNVGPVLNQMGISVEEASAALAVLHENAIKGGDAGTAMKSMLLQMTRNVPRVVTAWEKLGTSFYDSAGNARALDDVLKDIKKGLTGKTMEEQNTIIRDLAGSHGILALNSLLAADGIDNMRTSMEGGQTAQQVAVKQMESFVGQINQLKGSLETFMIVVVGPFVEKYLKPMVTWLVGAVNVVTDLVTKVPAFGEALMGVVTALIVLGPALKVMSMLSGLGKLFSGLTAITKVLTLANMQLAASWVLAAAPLIAVVALGVALGVALYEIGRALKIGDRIKEWVADFKRGIGMVKDRLVAFVKDLPKFLLRLFVNIVKALLENGIVKAFEFGYKQVEKGFNWVKDGILSLAGISSPSSFGLAVGQNIGQSVMGGIVQGLQAGSQNLGPAMGQVYRQLNRGGPQFARAAQPIRRGGVMGGYNPRAPIGTFRGRTAGPGSGGVVINIENALGTPEDLERRLSQIQGRRITQVYSSGM